MRGEMGAKYFSRIIDFERSVYNFRKSLSMLASQSPFDEAEKIEITLKNTHTTIQKQIQTMTVSAIPKSTQLLEFNLLSIGEFIFD